MPKVTCSMPVYNAETYLREAIDSILDQSFEDFELIACNDGSTDGSAEILEKYAKRDSRVVVINRAENRGLIETRNEILHHAKGEYLALMDADDMSLWDRFERQVEYLDSHPEHVLVGSRILLIDPDGHPMCALGIKETHEEIDAWHLEGHSGAAICNPTIMMRTDAVRAVGGYADGTACAEDYDLFLRLAEMGKLATMPDVLLHYRQHLSSVGYRQNSQQREAIRVAVENAYVRRHIVDPVRLHDELVPNRNAAYAYRQWVDWSLRGGNAETARRYAWKAIGAAPWSPRAWRSFARAWAIRPTRKELI